MKKDEEGNEKMDVTEDGTQPPLPWQHVASFALYKLFTSWGEDPNKGPKVSIFINLFFSGMLKRNIFIQIIVKFSYNLS